MPLTYSSNPKSELPYTLMYGHHWVLCISTGTRHSLETTTDCAMMYGNRSILIQGYKEEIKLNYDKNDRNILPGSSEVNILI